MSVTNFSFGKYYINKETRLSVSSWQDGSMYRGSVAIERKHGSKWSVDQTTVKEVCKDRDWLRSSHSGMIEADLYYAETGHVMPLGFYKNSRKG